MKNKVAKNFLNDINKLVNVNIVIINDNSPSNVFETKLHICLKVNNLKKCEERFSYAKVPVIAFCINCAIFWTNYICNNKHLALQFDFFS